jgi:hypothetical protein
MPRPARRMLSFDSEESSSPDLQSSSPSSSSGAFDGEDSLGTDRLRCDETLEGSVDRAMKDQQAHADAIARMCGMEVRV